MADPYKGQKVTVTCQDCGCQFEISRSRHYKIMASDNPTFRCKPCYKYWRKNVWYNELPEEKRNELSSKRSELSKGVWANMSEEKKEETNQKKSATRIDYTDEWKADVRERVQNTWQNKTAEEKAIHSEIRRRNTQAFWDNLDEMGLEEMRAKMAEAQKVYNESLTEEEKAARAARIAEANHNFWESLSDEERALVLQIRSEAQKKQWSEKSDESRNYIISRLVQGRIDWWNSLSEEEKIQYGLQHKEEFWDKMSEEEFKEWTRKASTGLKKADRNRLEVEFANILNVNHLPFDEQWSSEIEDPNFSTLFPHNTSTGSNKVSPFHCWDFKINCKSDPVLVDIDGSIHDPNKAKSSIVKGNTVTTLREYIDFNDSKRPYQTDGMDAYVVQAYDNVIDNLIDVKNIKTGEIMTLQKFITILNFANLDEEERREIVRS